MGHIHRDGAGDTLNIARNTIPESNITHFHCYYYEFMVIIYFYEFSCILA